MEEDLIKERHNKLKKLKDLGIDPYPSVSLVKDNIADILSNEKKLTGKDVTVAGRLLRLRKMGKASFGNIADFTGTIQIFFKLDSLKKDYGLLDFIDLGDIITVVGYVFRTKVGELTIHAKSVKLLAKSLRPFPDKFHGLSDIETRFRQRYLDFAVNPENREIIKLRAKLLKALRDNLEKEGFIETETPILQPLAGGAIAKPFVTHYNVYNTEVYLRIAPELYLKRLIVGGFEKVYELGRSFRNEGVDFCHNPEFTILEFYWAYADYNDLINFTKNYLLNVFRDIGIKKLSFEGNEIDPKKGWNKLEMRQAILDETKIDIAANNATSLFEKCKKLGLKDIKPNWSKGKIIDEIYKEKIRPKLIEPTFVIHHPLELSPLAKKYDENYAQRFQLVILGQELVNAYTELNDPLDQAQRFAAQKELKDEEAVSADSDFVRALEYGMPPTAGWGLGVDRLLILISGSHSIREVIAFPYMRPK